MPRSFANFFWQYSLWILNGLVLLYLFSANNIHPKIKMQKTMTTQEADSFFYQMHTTIFNIDGSQKLTIEAQSLTHFNENDTSQLIQPKVTIFKDSPNPWIITSKTGTTTQGTRHIEFQNSVHIHHQSDSIHPETQVDTSTLTVEPEKSIAYTDAPITLIQPFTQISGTGMHADLNSGEIRLLSNSRGKYVANPKKNR